MNDLTVIETGSLAVIEEDSKLWVNARDLHKSLEVGRDFSNWIKGRIEECGFEEGREYTKKQGEFDSPNLANQKNDIDRFSPNLAKTSKGGRPSIDYFLNVTAAIELAAMENTPQRKDILRLLSKIAEAWNNPEMIRKRAIQMGITIPGSRRPILESAQNELEPWKKAKEELNSNIDLVLRQFLYENYKETGVAKDKISVKDAYNLYLTYAVSPLTEDEFASKVPYVYFSATCWQGNFTGLKKIKPKQE